MKTSDDLFQLVKSLSRTEKAYFKKSASFHSIGDGNKYVKLFDSIEGLDSYDESIIIAGFKGDKFVNQISAAKNYLYNALLKSLKSYRQNLSKRDEVKHLLEDISVLFDKRLFGQAEKLLRRCKKISQSCEMFSEMMQILIWELKILVTQKAYEKKTDVIVNLNYEERKKILEKIINLYEYDKIEYNIVSAMIQGGKKKDSVLRKNLDEIISNDMLGNELLALSVSAKLKFNHIYASYYYAAGELNKSYEYLSREIELLEENESLLKEKFNDYLILMSNKLSISLELKNSADFISGLKKFRSNLDSHAVMKSEKLKFFIVNNSYMLELDYFKRTGEFEKVFERYNEFSEKLAGLKSEVVKSDFFSLQNILSQSYFGIGKFDDAVSCLMNILNDKESESKFPDFAFAKIYLLIIHYELNNFDYLEYLIKSTYYYFLKTGSMEKFERIIFRFLKKLADAATEKSIQNAFANLKEELMNVKEEPSVKSALKYFDFISWLESRIQKRSFKDVIGEMYLPR